MGRYSTSPTLFDDCKTITISDLKKWGYLKQGSLKSGTISWSRNGNKTGSIGIIVDSIDGHPVIELDYKWNDKPIKYKVVTSTIPSNIGVGELTYFVCPVTGKYCRKLYLIGGRFLHRQAFNGCCYESQTESHKTRTLRRMFDCYFAPDNIYTQLNLPYFKAQYGGKPTKKYTMLKRKLELYISRQCRISPNFHL